MRNRTCQEGFGDDQMCRQRESLADLTRGNENAFLETTATTTKTTKTTTTTKTQTAGCEDNGVLTRRDAGTGDRVV